MHKLHALPQVIKQDSPVSGLLLPQDLLPQWTAGVLLVMQQLPRLQKRADFLLLLSLSPLEAAAGCAELQSRFPGCEKL